MGPVAALAFHADIVGPVSAVFGEPVVLLPSAERPTAYGATVWQETQKVS